MPDSGVLPSAKPRAEPGAEPGAERSAIRLVAYFEGFKGVVVLLAASGLLSLIHRDLGELAERLVRHSHLDPASHYPRIFIDAADHLEDSRLVLLALGAAAYAAIRLAEAYGLFKQKAWAEVLAAGSGAVYLPIEMYEWLHRPTWLRASIFCLNALVVAVMIYALVQRQRRRVPPDPGAPSARRRFAQWRGIQD